MPPAPRAHTLHPIPDGPVPASAPRVAALGPAAAGPPPAALPVQRDAGPAAPPSLVKPPTAAAPRLSTVTVTAHASSAGPGGGRDAATTRSERAESPPAYSAQLPEGHRTVPDEGRAPAGAAGAFDARKLSDGQVDELTHRLIGPLTRLLRTELRMDRERIGRLRDPRR